jgi:hypothetical protein
MSISSETLAVNNSSAIRRIQHDVAAYGPPPFPRGAGGDLHVTFKRGKTYVYALPSSTYWLNFKNAASKGRYYVRVIKKRLDYFRKY